MESDNLKKYSKKIFIENLIKGVLFSLFASVIFAGVMNLILTPICNLSGFKYRRIIVVVLLALSFIATMVVSIKSVFKTRAEQVARRVDELGLDDRIVTMVQFKNDDSLIAKKQREDANEKLITIEPKMVKMKFPKFLVIAAVGGVIIGGSSFFIPEAKAIAKPQPTSYNVYFYSNGGTFTTEYLANNNLLFEDGVDAWEYQDPIPTKYGTTETNQNYDNYWYLILQTEKSYNESKFIDSQLFANNKTIIREGYSLVGWNYTTVDANGIPSKINPTTGLEMTETTYYMNGLNVKGDTYFIAIWRLFDEIIKEMIDDLREIVNSADVSQDLKDELNAEIDSFENDIFNSNYTNNEKIEKTKDFREEIIERLFEEKLKEEEEKHQNAGEVLIQHGEKIPSDALKEMGEGIKAGDTSIVDGGLDKIISETSNLKDQELADRLQQYIDALLEASDAARADGDLKLATALKNLADSLQNAKESATNGENEKAQEEIKDAVEIGKEEIKDALKEQENVKDAQEKADETIKDALDKLEGQTGDPKDNPEQPVNPNTSGSNSNSNSGSNTSNSGSNSGHSGSNSGHSGSNSGHSGSNSGHSGSNSGHSGSNSGHSGSNSGHSGSNSGHSGSNSGHSGSNSGHSGSNSGHSGSNSGHSGSNSGHSGSNSGSNTSGNNSNDSPLDEKDKVYDNVNDGNTPIDKALEDFYLEYGILPEEYEEYQELINKYLEAIK